MDPVTYPCVRRCQKPTADARCWQICLPTRSLRPALFFMYVKHHDCIQTTLPRYRAQICFHSAHGRERPVTNGNGSRVNKNYASQLRRRWRALQMKAFSARSRYPGNAVLNLWIQPEHCHSNAKFRALSVRILSWRERLLLSWLLVVAETTNGQIHSQMKWGCGFVHCNQTERQMDGSVHQFAFE